MDNNPTSMVISYPARFLITRTIIEFDTRIDPSVSIDYFHPTMFDQPARGSKSRECSILAAFEDNDRERSLVFANGKAKDVIDAYLADNPYCRDSMGEGRGDGTNWYVGVWMDGRERCEIQVRELRPGNEVPSVAVEETS